MIFFGTLTWIFIFNPCGRWNFNHFHPLRNKKSKRISPWKNLALIWLKLTRLSTFFSSIFQQKYKQNRVKKRENLFLFILWIQKHYSTVCVLYIFDSLIFLAYIVLMRLNTQKKSLRLQLRSKKKKRKKFAEKPKQSQWHS